jgi:predicted nucleic acid-binding protein
MPDPPRRIYWDACVFLSYVNDFDGRAHLLESILDEATRGDIELVTSTVSMVEVSFGAAEQARSRALPAIDNQIRQLWLPPSPVKLVEVHTLIAEEARGLVRLAMARQWSLKPMDAIHLATAKSLAVSVLHTYDQGLPRFAPDFSFSITEPNTPAPRLPGT